MLARDNGLMGPYRRGTRLSPQEEPIGYCEPTARFGLTSEKPCWRCNRLSGGSHRSAGAGQFALEHCRIIDRFLAAKH